MVNNAETLGNDPDETTEIQEPDSSAPESEPRRRRWAKVIGGVALLGVVAATAGGLFYKDKWNDDKDKSRVTNEIRLLSELADGDMQLRAGAVILREGVNVRTTPDTVGSNAFVRSNVDHVIGDGEALVVSAPIVADIDGVVWIGFSTEAPGTDSMTDRDIAKGMAWVNLGGLEIEGQGRDNPYVEYIETDEPPGATVDGRITESGRVLAEGSTAPVALGVEMEEWELEALQHGLGISPT